MSLVPCPHSLPQVSPVCSGSPGLLSDTPNISGAWDTSAAAWLAPMEETAAQACALLSGAPSAPSPLLSLSHHLLQTLTPRPQGARFRPRCPLGSLYGPRQLPCWGDREHSPHGQVPQAGSRAGSLGLCCPALCPFIATCPLRLVETRMERVEGWHRGGASEGEDRAGGLRGCPWWSWNDGVERLCTGGAGHQWGHLGRMT